VTFRVVTFLDMSKIGLFWVVRTSRLEILHLFYFRIDIGLKFKCILCFSAVNLSDRKGN